MRPVAIAACLALIVFATPSVASACSIVWSPTDRTPAAEWRRAREAVRTAPVIIDAEVIRPYVQGKQTALLKAHRIHKGPNQEIFEVGAPTGCNREFTVEGERTRVLLDGGPDVYFDRDPGLDWQVDRLLKSDRRRDWPYRPGPAGP